MHGFAKRSQHLLQAQQLENAGLASESVLGGGFIEITAKDFFSPVRQMRDEVLDLFASGVVTRLHATETRRIHFDQAGVE